MPKRTILILGVSVACIAIPNVVFADFYDEFHDGEYQEDPNVWDVDDPCWTSFFFPSGPSSGVPAFGVEQGWFWMTYQRTMTFGAALVCAYVETGDHEPNTSESWWDHTRSHYIMARTFNVYAQDDPNNDRGSSFLMLHTNPATWLGMVFEYVYHKYGEGGVRPRISACTGSNFPIYRVTRIEADDPCHPDEAGGFWMLFEFDSDGSPEADPNGKYLRAALWNGGKFDWSGDWLLEVDLGDPCSWNEPNIILEGLQDGWVPEGLCIVGGEEWYDQLPNVPDVFVAFDQVEARTGRFDPNHPCALTVKMKDCCDLDINPDLLADPNHDPNDLDELRRYTNGTPIVLDAVVPCGNKAFKKWKIMGPNDTGDPLYQIVSDTNQVLYLTMDGDYEVKAVCKCGGGIEPFAGMVLLLLGLGVLVRRML